jgi:hypothetical protein
LELVPLFGTREIYPTFVIYSNETFSLKFRLHLQVPLINKLGVWCAISATIIIGPIDFRETINARPYVYKDLNVELLAVTQTKGRKSLEAWQMIQEN